MGNRDAQLNVIQFLSQTLLTAPMVRWFGLRGVLLVLPIGDLLMGLAYFTTPALTIANYAKIFDGSMKYGTNQVTKEMLYLPTPTAVKYQAKAFIDVFFHRVAKGLSAAILLVFTQALGFSAPALFYPLIVFVAIWVWLVVRIERLYRHNLQGRLLAEFGPQSTAHGGANLGDPAHALARLEQHFGAEVLDPNAVRLALIDHLRNHPLHEPSATAAAHALVLGGREERALAIEWLQITVAPQFAPLLAAMRDLPLDPSGRRRLFNQCVPATAAES